MVVIKIFGLDPFVVGRMSRLETDAIVRELGLDNEEIFFISPDEYIFHRGVEQTSWQAIIYVTTDFKLTEKQEEKLADILLTSCENMAMNTHIQFVYYPFGHVYGANNTEYPRYITSDQIKDDEEYEEEHHHDEDEDDENEKQMSEHEIFMGNIFAGHNLDEEFHAHDHKEDKDDD